MSAQVTDGRPLAAFSAFNAVRSCSVMAATIGVPVPTLMNVIIVARSALL